MWGEMECFGNEERKNGLAAWEVWGDGRGMEAGEVWKTIRNDYVNFGVP